MIQWLRDFRQYRRAQEVKDLESRLAEKDRLIEVLRAEIDSMAQVIARDRARVAAELAHFNRERATAEGINDERTREGVRRFSAQSACL